MPGFFIAPHGAKGRLLMGTKRKAHRPETDARKPVTPGSPLHRLMELAASELAGDATVGSGQSFDRRKRRTVEREGQPDTPGADGTRPE